ncbi:MAG: ABC transporter substrate-binding protein [bacterium]|nr:ABC transporter substrate-binding protein [bacterium]
MKRFFRVLPLLLLALALLGAFGQAAAQEAPEAVFYGGWPYALPPDSHLNSFAAGGPQTSLGIFHELVEMPQAMFLWAENRWVPFLGSEFGFEGDNAYVVTMNSEALWSDGSPVTSDDLIATYAIGRILGWSDYNYVDYLERVDDHTVRFVLKQPSTIVERLILKTRVRAAATYGDLAARATELYESGAASDSAEWTALADEIRAFRPETLLASGPYTFELEDMGDAFLTLDWQPNSLLSDDVNFGQMQLWNGETEAVTPLFLNGDIAYGTYGFPPATEQELISAGLRITRGPQFTGPAIYFNHTIHPWDVPEVRQAVAHAIDRAESAFLGKGVGARPVQYMAGFSDNLVPNWLSEDIISSLNQYAFDVDGAAALLESVGFTRGDDGLWLDDEGNPVEAEITVPAEFADWVPGVQNAADQLNEFGFQISVVAQPFQEQEQNVYDGNFELAARNWGIGNPHPFSTFNQPFSRYNGLNGPGMQFPMQFEFNGEQVDLTQLIADSAAGLDVEAQQAVVGEIAQIFNGLLPLVPLYETYANNPLNEELVAGAPADDDPIWLNGGGDNYIIIMLATGQLTPAQ